MECVPVDAKTRPVNVLPRLTPLFIFSLEVRGCFCTHVRSKTEDSLHEAIRHHTHSHLPTMFRSILMGNNCSSSRRKGRQDVRSLAKVEFCAKRIMLLFFDGSLEELSSLLTPTLPFGDAVSLALLPCISFPFASTQKRRGKVVTKPPDKSATEHSSLRHAIVAAVSFRTEFRIALPYTLLTPSFFASLLTFNSLHTSFFASLLTFNSLHTSFLTYTLTTVK